MNPLKNLNILIVDDHPFIIQGYKNVINLYPKKKYEFTFYEAVDCQTGYEAIVNSDIEYDIALLDISMPVYEEKNINTGEDLAKLLLERMPECKIVMLTMHEESLKVLSIIKEIDPIGLIIKNDLDYQQMTLALTTILKNEKYYSDAVIVFLNMLQNERIYADVFDKEILRYLKKGVPADDVALYIPLSLAQVMDRVEKMKIVLEIPDADDKELLEKAISRGMMLP
jgi:DNA-binding NarL/FixJ family response regulator